MRSTQAPPHAHAAARVRSWDPQRAHVGLDAWDGDAWRGYCLAQYFLWFGSTFYGGLKKVGVVTVGLSCSPLTEQWQGNGDGGMFPQPKGVS